MLRINIPPSPATSINTGRTLIWGREGPQQQEGCRQNNLLEGDQSVSLSPASSGSPPCCCWNAPCAATAPSFVHLALSQRQVPPPSPWLLPRKPASSDWLMQDRMLVPSDKWQQLRGATPAPELPAEATLKTLDFCPEGDRKP